MQVTVFPSVSGGNFTTPISFAIAHTFGFTVVLCNTQDAYKFNKLYTFTDNMQRNTKSVKKNILALFFYKDDMK